MKSYKILSTKGAVLDKYQLETYLEKLASDHILKEKSDKIFPFISVLSLLIPIHQHETDT